MKTEIKEEIRSLYAFHDGQINGPNTGLFGSFYVYDWYVSSFFLTISEDYDPARFGFYPLIQRRLQPEFYSAVGYFKNHLCEVCVKIGGQLVVINEQSVVMYRSFFPNAATSILEYCERFVLYLKANGIGTVDFLRRRKRLTRRNKVKNSRGTCYVIISACVCLYG